ncbi:MULTISPECIES: multicopper oxidase domain-containing protein [unclassified Streptomyces]|uniref:multicopper oxidase domain-containing protein n=1 Tax=unclassified Streptomyces TaxID=2593676 RepID=UPI0022578933|nr:MULTISPECIES: multicopper oxidase domain-containing protein [unclassified Streptomyces]WSP59596.1 multicopper oxidase domain-containing protein [Streptomyces sp. NBC_01241]WSU19884.1 multicopper oxidase domain-containing protein [Streptomyces sp. NBC_01108]MCX4791357.1 multicopper oxidase domain-containing protein [Streptomyces sp. NBC_01221]MCX4792897.1 multicopper oxidase domain-containing protein [Streptomyces sp. NBC_01242]WSP60807.1 multicopper oxidase domain-containing protein [Strept
MTDSGAGTRRLFSRRAFATGAAAAAVVPTVLGATAAAPKDKPGEGNGQGNGKGTVRELTLYMENLPNGEMGYGLEPGKASIPGPLIELTEGDTMHIKVVNNLNVAASLHVHGVDYDVASDGTKMNDSVVEPGGQRTYVWRTHAPGPNHDGTWEAGSAGYWQYHDHNVGTEHGTGGLKKGLYGPVIVRRKGDVLPDKQFTVVFNDMTINNKAHHDAPTFTAVRGERVEFIVITHGEFFHTFHVHGHRWVDNRTGILQGPQDVSAVIDTKTVGPGDSFGFQVIAGARVGAGAWMYHCHVQSHADMGMVGVFLVTEADGTVPGGMPHH